MRTQFLTLSVAAMIGLFGCNRSTVEANNRGAATSGAPVTFFAPKRERLVLPQGTTLQVRLNRPISTASSRPGDRFEGKLAMPVTIDGKTVLPAGTQVEGVIRNAKAPGRQRGRAVLSIALSSIQLNGRGLAVTTSSQSRLSSTYKKRNAGAVTIPADTEMTFRLQQSLTIG